MDVGVIGTEPLVGRQARSHRQVGFIVAVEGLYLQRTQQLLQLAAVGLNAFPVALDTAPRERCKVFVVEFPFEPGDFVTQLL